MLLKGVFGILGGELENEEPEGVNTGAPGLNSDLEWAGLLSGTLASLSMRGKES